jgi:hypothetical protein
VNADANDIAFLNGAGINLFQRLIDKYRITERRWSSGGNDKQPPRRYDGGSERNVAGINEMNSHLPMASFSLVDRVTFQIAMKQESPFVNLPLLITVPDGQEDAPIAKERMAAASSD